MSVINGQDKKAGLGPIGTGMAGANANKALAHELHKPVIEKFRVGKSVLQSFHNVFRLFNV